MPIKPRISYIEKVSTPVPFPLNTSVVRKRTGSTYVNWSSKSELTDYVDTLRPHPDSDTYLYAHCSCGRDYEYSDKTNIPSTSVVCECGRKIIQYGL